MVLGSHLPERSGMFDTIAPAPYRKNVRIGQVFIVRVTVSDYLSVRLEAMDSVGNLEMMVLSGKMNGH
jgi:hypothetical protein